MKHIKLIIAVLFLLIVPTVFADLVITPSSSDITVYKGQSQNFQLTLLNNNSFPITNVSLSNLNYFSFPVTLNLIPFQSTQISYSVLTDAVFNQAYVSTASFYYQIPYNGTPLTYQINITSSAFQPSTLNIMQNDSIIWNNMLTQDIQVKDFSSGFPQVNVPALSSVTVQYNTIANYSFYNYPLGYTGYLNILDKSSTAYAHDSGYDKPVYFNLHSLLNPSTMQLSLLTPNFTMNYNQTIQGIVQIQNTDPTNTLYNVNLSASKWITFAQNNFNLSPMANNLVFFNITPSIIYTNDTNKTHILTIYASSLNAGNTSVNFPVFINYYNLNIININGTNYTINFLSINDTINACLQHEHDAGFEQCAKLWKYNNVTQIIEVPANISLSELTIKDWMNQMNISGESALRVENQYNLLGDEMRGLMGEIQTNVTANINNISRQQAIYQESWRKIQTAQTIWLIVMGSLIIIAIIYGLINWFGGNYDLWESRVKARQE